MHFDTDGVYTLQYTAEDSCGNTTTEERTVEVVALNTVLFTDGTFIINEKSTDRDANIALHGAVTNEYPPLNLNGETDEEKYIFTTNALRYWFNERSQIINVEIGSDISPLSMAYWFSECENCTSMDFENLDTSDVTNLMYMFRSCASLSSLDLNSFNTSNVTDMSNMFAYCSALTSLDLSNFDTSNVTNMQLMFKDCTSLTDIDISSFNTSNVTNMSNMFASCSALTSLDLSNFDTSNVTNMQSVFYALTLTTLDLSSFDFLAVEQMGTMFTGSRSLTTIYVSPNFALPPDLPAYAGTYMFDNCRNLVGGAGTRWSSLNTGLAYAKIDGGTADPGYFTAKA